MKNIKKIYIFLPIILFIFLISIKVEASPFYFDDFNTSDSDWGNLDNWWEDEDLTIQAISLPGESDDVYILKDVFDNTTIDPAESITINNFTVSNGSFVLPNQLIVNGNVLFKNDSLNVAIIFSSNDVVFEDFSVNDPSGQINGDTNFYNDTINYGIINGDVSFYDESINWIDLFNNSYIYGSCYFYNFSVNKGLIDGSIAYFYDSSHNDSQIDNDASFYDTSYNSSLGTVGFGYFYEDSYNDGVVSSDGFFRDTSSNTSTGEIQQDLYLYSTATNEGVVGGSVIVKPTTSISDATNITKISATLNGSIEATGGTVFYNGGSVFVLQRGFNYGLTTDYGSTFSQDGIFYEGIFSTNILDLTCNTTYHFRSFATNFIETDYSEDGTFTTSSCVDEEPDPTCSDGIQNQDETGIDTGGVCTPAEPEPVTHRTTGSYSPLIWAQMQQQLTQPTTPTVPKYTFTKLLKSRIKDNEVKELQKYLNNHNYPLTLTGLGSLNNETDYFGPLTLKAVKLFQQANNLVPDGIVGPLTRGVLNK